MYIILKGEFQIGGGQKFFIPDWGGTKVWVSDWGGTKVSQSFRLGGDWFQFESKY